MATVINNTIIKKKKKLNSNKEEIIEQEDPVYTVTAKDHWEQFVNIVILGAVAGIIGGIIQIIF